MTVIAIDIGTINSVVSALVDGNVQLLKPSHATGYFVPSAVAFRGEELLVGEEAVKHYVNDPSNTFSRISRLIGRRWDDPWMVANFRKFPYDIVNGQGRLFVKGNYNGEDRYLRPELILSVLIMHLKEIAEKCLNQTVSRAVISVPACFDSNQRLATMNAAKIAGLTVERLVSAPAAVAMAYRSLIGPLHNKLLLVFVMGAGSCDASLIRLNDDEIEVIATAGNSCLGGVEFDESLVDHFVSELKTKMSIDIRSIPAAFQELREACVKAKTILSVQPRAHILLHGILDGSNYAGKISREEFEALNAKTFDEIPKVLDTLLTSSATGVDEVDDIVLAGGSTWIPRIQEILSNYFQQKPLCKTLSPEEAVCTGTCIYANSLSSNTHPAFSIKLTEVNPVPLRVLVKGELLNNIVQRNAPLPIQVSKTYTTSVDCQECMTLSLVQSDSAKKRLENIVLTGISSSATGVPRIVVTFMLDENGILRVKAYEQIAQRKLPLEFTGDVIRPKPSELASMISEAGKLWLADNQYRAKVAVREALREYIKEKQQNLLNEVRMSAKHLLINDKCVAALRWIDDNPKGDIAQYEEKRAEFDSSLASIGSYE